MSERPELRVIDAEPASADVIRLLEDALAVAREGKVSSVAVAIVYRDGTSGQCWSDAPSLSCLVGSVARMEYALIRFSEGE